MTVLVKEPIIERLHGVVEVNGHQKYEQPLGFTEATVRAASAAKNEPEWMLEKRLEGWRTFEALPWPKATDEDWRRTRLTGFKLDKFQPFAQPRTQTNDAPSAQLQQMLDEMESAASLAFDDGSACYRDTSEDLAGKGVIFTDRKSVV